MGKLVNGTPIEKMKGHILIESGIKLPLIDRLRLIFGAKLAVRTEVHTQWRGGDYQAYNILLVEELYSKAKLAVNEFFSGIHAWLKRRS